MGRPFGFSRFIKETNQLASRKDAIWGGAFRVIGQRVLAYRKGQTRAPERQF